MKTKMFYAKSMSEGLKKISAEFGDDAIILSNRKVQGGIEIMAAMEEGDEIIETYQYESQEAAQEAHNSDIIKNVAAGNLPTSKEDMAALLANIGPLSKKTQVNTPKPAAKNASVNSARIAPQKSPAKPAPAVQQPVQQVHHIVEKRSNSDRLELVQMQKEIQDLKSLLENQNKQLVPEIARTAEPAQPENVSNNVLDQMEQDLSEKGFSKRIISRIISSVNPLQGQGVAGTWNQVQSYLASSFESYRFDPVTKGGIYAFVGMTGSGKTTTLSKMAARFVVENGAHDLLLITLDKFKVGSQEGLKSMAKILRCDFEVPKGSESLEEILKKYQHKKLILIDTCGSFIGKEYFARQLESGQMVKRIKSFVVYPCSASFHAIERDTRANKLLQVSGAIMSKVDECPEAGAVLSMVMLEQLPMVYWCNGQKIPEDLHLVNPGRLVRTLVGQSGSNYEQFDSDELKMIANF